MYYTVFKIIYIYIILYYVILYYIILYYITLHYIILYYIILYYMLKACRYKKREEYEQMLRLVSKYRKELLNDTYKHIAEQYEMKGNLRKAEHYYVEAKMWTSAMSMYRQLEQWEDAKRVAKVCRDA